MTPQDCTNSNHVLQVLNEDEEIYSPLLIICIILNSFNSKEYNFYPPPICVQLYILIIFTSVFCSSSSIIQLFNYSYLYYQTLELLTSLLFTPVLFGSLIIHLCMAHIPLWEFPISAWPSQPSSYCCHFTSASLIGSHQLKRLKHIHRKRRNQHIVESARGVESDLQERWHWASTRKVCTWRGCQLRGGEGVLRLFFPHLG